MTDATVLGGVVQNGRRATAIFTFYSGTVGVRDRGDTLELSYFATATPPSARRVEGLLDGKLVTLLSIVERHLDANGETPRAGEVRVVTLTVAPVTIQ